MTGASLPSTNSQVQISYQYLQTNFTVDISKYCKTEANSKLLNVLNIMLYYY